MPKKIRFLKNTIFSVISRLKTELKEDRGRYSFIWFSVASNLQKLDIRFACRKSFISSERFESHKTIILSAGKNSRTISTKIVDDRKMKKAVFHS